MFLRSQTKMHGLDLSGIIKKQALRIFFFSAGWKQKQQVLKTATVTDYFRASNDWNKQTNNKNEIK